MMQDEKHDSRESAARIKKSYEEIFGNVTYAKEHSVQNSEAFEIFNLNPPKRMNYYTNTRML